MYTPMYTVHIRTKGHCFSRFMVMSDDKIVQMYKSELQVYVNLLLVDSITFCWCSNMYFKQLSANLCVVVGTKMKDCLY